MNTPDMFHWEPWGSEAMFDDDTDERAEMSTAIYESVQEQLPDEVDMAEKHEVALKVVRAVNLVVYAMNSDIVATHTLDIHAHPIVLTMGFPYEHVPN
jgi:hypothetical protein